MAHFAISVPIGSWHPFLPAALASLRAQGDRVSVALLDASNDQRVMDIAEANDDWLAYRRHGPDKGQSDAILEGWENVTGDWLGWLNADDIMMPGTLETIEASLSEDSSLEIIYGHSTILDETGAMTGYHFNVAPPGPKLLQAGIISQPSCLFSRAAYDRAGGLNRDLHYVMDWDLWIRLYKSDAKFGFVDQPLSMVLWGGDTKTASLNKARRNELSALISAHAPEEAKRGTFRAFVIHAVVDMLWPPAFKAAVVKRLRHNGPQLFGFRANGQIEGAGILHLAHFDPAPKQGVKIYLAGPTDTVTVSSSAPIDRIAHEKDHIEVYFEHALPASEAYQITLKTHATGKPCSFFRAAWITQI